MSAITKIISCVGGMLETHVGLKGKSVQHAAHLRQVMNSDARFNVTLVKSVPCRGLRNKRPPTASCRQAGAHRFVHFGQREDGGNSTATHAVHAAA